MRPTKRLGTIPSSNGMPGFLGEAERRRAAGVGHRHDEVGLDRRLAGELAAHRLAAQVDVLAEDPLLAGLAK